MLRPAGNRTRSGGTAVLGMAELAELGRDVPHGKPRMRVENGVDVPPLPSCNGHEWLVASLPPSTYVLSSLLESPPQRVGSLLVEAVQRIAVHVVSHLGLVDVTRTGLLGVPEHLVGHL